MTVLDRLGDALLLSLGMAWQVGWSLVLGFALSVLVQALVSTGRMRAALVPSLAFLFSSTNLVIELGLILWLLLGWQFTLAEWVGGLVLIAVMALLVRLTAPRRLVEAARHHPEAGGEHNHDMKPVPGDTLAARLRRPELPVRVAQSFAMDLSMLWKDLAIGFVVAGLLGAFVPAPWWAALFLQGAPPWLRVPADALLGPLVAMLSFVCSSGNVPLAAILWRGGIGFGGVLAFLYADLLVLPLLDVYRRQYGVRMMLYMAAVFYATMVVAALVVNLFFTGAGLVPSPAAGHRVAVAHFGLDHTCWLNLAFGALAVWLFVLHRRHPMMHAHQHA